MTETLSQSDDDTLAVSRHRTVTLFALCVAGVVVSLQQTVVIPMLPQLERELHTTVSGVTWMFTTALLTGAVATPLLSRFGDMFGKKRMVMVTLGLLLVGSVICAFGTTLAVEIVGRALQGTSTAMIPLAIGMIRDVFPPHRVTTAIGIMSATMGVGSTLGMIMTGVIAKNTTTYHPLFWISTALSAAGAILVAVTAKDIGTRHGGKPDYLGAILLAGVLVCLLLGISQGPVWGWGSGKVVGLFIGAVVICVVWILTEMRVPQPLVRIPLLVGARSASANLASALLGFAMYGAFTLVSNLVQTPKAQFGYGLSGSVLDVGLYGIPSAVLMTFFSFRTGAIVRRIGAAYTLALGSAFGSVASLWLVLSHSHPIDIIMSNSFQGIGFGIGYAALGTLAVQHVSMSESSIASGINSLVRTAGGAVSGAITASVLSSVTIAHTGVPTIHAYVICFFALTVGAWLTVAVAVGSGMRHRHN